MDKKYGSDGNKDLPAAFAMALAAGEIMDRIAEIFGFSCADKLNAARLFYETQREHIRIIHGEQAVTDSDVFFDEEFSKKLAKSSADVQAKETKRQAVS